LQACQISKHCRLGEVLNDSHHGAQLAKDSFGFFNHKIEQKKQGFSMFFLIHVQICLEGFEWNFGA
jgi:hypothetical protein